MATRLVIEWTRASVRAALAEGGGARWRLRALQSQPLGPTGGTPETLRSLLKMMKVASAYVIGVLSREQVITRVVKFPTTDQVELTQMAELYAKAQLPYPREQTVMDFHVLNQQAGFSTIAIVACQREVVDRQVLLLREAGLSVGMLTISSWGVLGWYRHLALKERLDEPSLIVNVDDSRTDLVLIANQCILSSRSVGQGAQDWGGANDTGELLALEIERSRAAIRKELPGTEVRSLLLTGLGTLPQWKEYVAQRLSLPVTIIESQRPFTGSAMSMAAPISPVVIGGLACSDASGLLNLSPAEIRVQLSHRQQVRELVTVSVLLVGVLAMGSTLLSLQVSRQQQVAAQLDKALSELAPTARRIQAYTRSAQLVGSVLEDRRQVAVAFAGVFRQTSSSITLEGLTFERTKRELVLRGNAASTQDVLAYVKQLEHLEGIQGVDLRYTTRRSTPAGERTDFELVLHQRHIST